MFKVFHLHPGHQPLVHPFSSWRGLCNPEASVKPFTANPQTPQFSKEKHSSSFEAAWAPVLRELEEIGPWEEHRDPWPGGQSLLLTGCCNSDQEPGLLTASGKDEMRRVRGASGT